MVWFTLTQFNLSSTCAGKLQRKHKKETPKAKKTF